MDRNFSCRISSVKKMALFSIIFHIIWIFWIFIPKMGISHKLDSVILESFPTSGILGFKTVKPCRELILIKQKNSKILVENEAKREGENPLPVHLGGKRH